MVRALIATCFAFGCAGTESELVPPPPCGDLELTLADGSCFQPGVPVDGCAPGFVHDSGYGCTPILPAEPCPPGRIAIPGDASCRPVMECAEGKWGDIPIEPNTVYVDAAYAGLDGDGSAGKPYTTIVEALAAAEDNAIVAVAEGRYQEEISIGARRVRLWGVCPDKVELVGMVADSAAIYVVTASASGSEVHGLAVTGSGAGFGISGATDVWLDRLWVHDTGYNGIDVSNPFGAASARITDSLIELARRAGVVVMGTEVSIEASAVRDGLPDLSDQRFGYGIIAQLPFDAGVSDPSARARLTVRKSLVERFHGAGVFVGASDATIEASVVRGGLPFVAEATGGVGITVQACMLRPGCMPTVRGSAVIAGSVLEQNHELGLLIAGADATVDTTVIRATMPRAIDGRFGRGATIQIPCVPAGCDPAAPAHVSLSRSLIDENADVGIVAYSSELTLEASVVNRTLAPAGIYGDGVSIVAGETPASALIDRCLIADIARAGLSNFGAAVSLENSAIRCASFDIEAEQTFMFDDRGGNRCGCPSADGTCTAVSAGLEAPEAIGSVD